MSRGGMPILSFWWAGSKGSLIMESNYQTGCSFTKGVNPMTLQKSSPEIPGAYHDGSRQLQDQFDSRRIADRLEQVNTHTTFGDRDRAFIEATPMFFLATADSEGRPDCSYKGGMPR